MKLAVLPGDGIGPEVIHEALRVLRCASDRFGFQAETKSFDLGAERYLRTGETLPEETFAHLRADFDAILVGAFGDPRVPSNVHAKDILLGLRQRLDLYVNLRPVRLLAERFCPLKGRGPQDVDLAVVRENTESVYTGIGGHLRKGTQHEVAQSIMIHTRMGCDRLLRYAFELARKRRKILTLCDKANAIPHAHGIWRRALAQMAPEFPDVEARTLYADVAAMRMVTNPHEFDVVVGDNLMGDMLSDLAAALVGGLGLAPSASLHPGVHALYEPVHGSAPDIVGTGRANPLAAILSVSMLLADFGEQQAADAVADACASSVLSGQTTPDLGGSLSTSEVASQICSAIASS
ncbi:MAG TPA: 3-isopropylmalate dehydrogenase [Myxococcales bacterium]|nr:3-isopropylmalate dehydrogenase [Myxococcales bacterium]